MNDGERGLPRVPMARDTVPAVRAPRGTTPGGPGPAAEECPVSETPDRHLPPRREQLPLPRRDGQSHLEPQLREPGGAGSGTPFEAFDADGVEDAETGDAGSATPPSGERVARFRDAVRRASTGSRRRTG